MCAISQAQQTSDSANDYKIDVVYGIIVQRESDVANNDCSESKYGP